MIDIDLPGALFVGFLLAYFAIGFPWARGLRHSLTIEREAPDPIGTFTSIKRQADGGLRIGFKLNADGVKAAELRENIREPLETMRDAIHEMNERKFPPLTGSGVVVTLEIPTNGEYAPGNTSDMAGVVIPPPSINNAGEPWGYRLSDHFTLAEFIASDTAKARSIDNTLPPELWANAVATCKGLEKVRTALGNRAVILLSGYRCRRLNEAVGGADDSDHMKALAGDFICPSFGTPYDIAKALSMLELDFDQIILEPTWVHIGFGPRLRRELLTKLKGGGYIDGIVHGAHA